MSDIVKKAVGPSSPKASNLGLLLLRVGIGLIFIRYGFLKLSGGPELWAQVGAMAGFTFAQSFWGVCAAITEFIGGIALVLGLFVRGVVIFMATVMILAVLYHYHKGDPWNVLSQPLALLCVFSSLLLLGSGKYSLDNLIYGKLK